MSKSIKYNGVDYEFEIMDSAGQVCFHPIYNTHLFIHHVTQDEYSIFNPKHAIGIHGYILVYSIAVRNSFKLIEPLYDTIVDFRGTQDIPCVIVGSKTDLEVM